VVDKKKVLFVAYGGGHVNMIVPVVQAILAKDEWAVEVVGLTTAGAVLDRAGIAHLGFKDIVGEDDAAALAWGRHLSAGVNSGAVAPDETVAYMGLSYADLEAQHGAAKAGEIYAAQGRHAFLPVRSMRRFLDKIQPDLVVATNAPRAERAAILAAQDAGIAAICIVDLYPPADGAWLKEDSYAQKVCVLNDTAKQMLIASGRNADDIAVTGNPAFDRHYLFARGERAGELSREKIVVGFASNILPQPPAGKPDGVLQREVFERLENLCGRNGYTLALRQHPNEKAWENIGDAVNCSGMAIDAYLASLDMLITFPSTIALEAQIHGVRVGLLDFTSLSVACAYLFNGDFEAIGQVQDIDGLKVVRDAPHRVQGRAAQSATNNVCAVISELMEQVN
jgi:hypothetical protein